MSPSVPPQVPNLSQDPSRVPAQQQQKQQQAQCRKVQIEDTKKCGSLARGAYIDSWAAV